MKKTRAKIVSGWIGSGTAKDPYRPAVTAHHGLKNWTDTTGADPKAGGTFAIEVHDDAAKIAQVEADVRYSGKVTRLPEKQPADIDPKDAELSVGVK